VAKETLTIRDVADRAGVSATTVSHVLNGTRRVEPETARRVLDAVAEMGYRPNAVARSMRHKQTYTVGIVQPDISNPFFADLARALEDAMFANGYSAIFCNSDRDADKEARYLEVLLSKQVDGLLLISAADASDRVRAIAQQGFPMVVVDRELEGLRVSTVMVDNESGGLLAGRYLVGLGHRRLAVIGGPDRLRPSARRLDGFRTALAEVGLDVAAGSVIQGDFRAESGHDAMRRLLASDTPPEAVFAENDMMAIGAIRAVQEAGRRVPEDISIMGFDDIVMGQAIDPTLTTVAQPIDDITTHAVRLLFDRLRDPDGEPEQVMLPVELIVRGSCAPRTGNG
jgi:LacI family transcriptional regulator